MLMVDKIVFISPQEVHTEFYLDQSNIFIKKDHFSEIGLIENAAQTCSAISGQYFFDKDHSKNCSINPSVLGYISSIKKIKIHQLPKVNTFIETRAYLLSHSKGEQYSICVLKVIVCHEDTVFLEGELNLFLESKTYEKD